MESYSSVEQKILSGCNPAQCEAIVHDHQVYGPLLILAGAGSGKTAVLTRRIQWLISCCHVSASQILGLTFTAKAAAEMRERMTTAKPHLCTFHSLALSLIRDRVQGVPNWKRLGFAKMPSPQEESSGEWLYRVMQCGLSAKKLKRQDLFNPEQQLQSEAIQTLRKKNYQEAHVTFDDLIWLAIDLLQRFKEVRQTVHDRWTYCLVDEYQDINPEQYRLVRLIVGERPNLFVVGDDDQAIYGFRGADVRNILKFQDDFPQCRVVKLELNYRSTPSVLQVANQIFKSKPLSLRKTLRAGSLRMDPLFQQNAKVELWKSNTAFDEIQRMSQAMQQWKKENQLEWTAFAILVRFHRQGEWYEQALKEYGIPVEGKSSSGVHIETLHASKGLQYPIVFYAGLALGLAPADYRGGSTSHEDHFNEEKRLFYVGVTRAECRLVLLFCKKRHWQGCLQRFKPSPFLEALEPESRYKHWRLAMGIVLHKLWKSAMIVAFMAQAVVQEFFLRLQSKVTQDWIDSILMRWARFCLRILEYKLDVKGQEHLQKVDWSRPVFVVCNHQSYIDIPAVLVALDRRLGFVAKRELDRIPLLGYWMRKIGCLIIDRQKKGIGQEIAQNIQASSLSPRIVIFPEGTRSKNGELGPFKSGAFRYACDFKATLLPIVLHKSRDAWENRKHFGHQVHGHCQILEPFDLSMEALNPKELQLQVRSRIQESL